MRPRPSPAARAKLAEARIQAVMLRVDAIRGITEAGVRLMASPEPSLEAAEALARRMEALERASLAEAAQPTPVGPSSTRRTRRTRSALR